VRQPGTAAQRGLACGPSSENQGPCQQGAAALMRLRQAVFVQAHLENPYRAARLVKRLWGLALLLGLHYGSAAWCGGTETAALDLGQVVGVVGNEVAHWGVCVAGVCLLL